MYSIGKHIIRSASILPLILLFCTCGKTYTDYAAKAEFRYYNRFTTPLQIEIRQGLNSAFAKYDIPPDDSISLFTTGETIEETTEAEGYTPGILSDTTIVRFYDTLCYVEFRNGNMLHKINNYRSIRKGDREFLFMFDLDTALIEKSTKCK